MNEEQPVSREIEEQQHKARLDELGILVSPEELDEEYNRSLEICQGNQHDAEKLTTWFVRVCREAPQLAESINKGEIKPTDLYDSTGRLTLAGKIAKVYVDSEVQDGGSVDWLREEHPTFRSLFDALTAQRVDDVNAAEAADYAEAPQRDK